MAPARAAEANRKVAVIVGTWSGFAAIGLHAGAFGPTLPALAARADVPEDRMSMSFLLAGIAAALCTPAVGALADHMGTRKALRRLLGGALLADACSAALQTRFAVMVQPWNNQLSLLPLAFLWGVSGIAISTVISVGNATAVALYPGAEEEPPLDAPATRRRSTADDAAPSGPKADALYASLAALGCGYSIGNALATAGAGDAGVAVLDQAAAVLAISGCLAVGLPGLLPDDVAEPAAADVDGDDEATQPLLEAADDNEATSVAGTTIAVFATLSSARIDLRLALSLVFNAMVVGCEIAFGSWVGTLSEHACGATPQLAGTLGSSFWIAYTFGRIVFLGAAVFGASPWVALVCAYPPLLAGLGIATSVLWDAAAWERMDLVGGQCAPVFLAAGLYGLGRSAGFISMCAIVGKRCGSDGKRTSAAATEQALVGCAGSVGAAAIPCLVGALGGASGHLVGKSLILCLLSATAIEITAFTVLASIGIDLPRAARSRAGSLA